MPCFLAAYLFLVWLSPRISTKDEIYPFFSWRLFARTPGWEVSEIGLIVHTIDDAPVARPHYIVPGGSIRDHKALRSTIHACRTRPPTCDAEVDQRLYAIVNRRTGGENVEFSIVSMRIDLRAVHGNLARLASSDARRSKFYRVAYELGRWTTGGGTASSPPPPRIAGKPLQNKSAELF